MLYSVLTHLWDLSDELLWVVRRFPHAWVDDKSNSSATSKHHLNQIWYLVGRVVSDLVSGVMRVMYCCERWKCVSPFITCVIFRSVEVSGLPLVILAPRWNPMELCARHVTSPLVGWRWFTFRLTRYPQSDHVNMGSTISTLRWRWRMTFHKGLTLRLP